MATELIASGAGYAASSDFSVTAGTPKCLTIYYTGFSEGIKYGIYRKSSGGAYQRLFTLTPQNMADHGVILAGGTYQARRDANSNASSLESD